MAAGTDAEESTPRETTVPQRSRLRARGQWVGIGALVLVAAGVFAWWHYAGRKSTDDAQVDGDVTPIAAKVGGIVREVRVEDDQPVKAGDVLVVIDPREYEVALARAEADLQEAEAGASGAAATVPLRSTVTQSELTSARAQHTNAETGVTLAGQQLEAARANLVAAQARERQAQAVLRNAEQNEQRLRSLVEKDEVSRQQYDAAVTAAAAERAALDSARAAVSEAETGVGVAQSRVTQAQGQVTQAASGVQAAGTAPQQMAVSRAQAASAESRVAQARASVAQARLNLDYTTVRAPSDGVVSRKSVQPGQIVQPGQPLVALVSVDHVWVTANFKETQLAEIHPGQRAEIDVDAYGSHTYAGRVESIAPATGARFSLLPPENASGNFVKVVQRVPVRIVIEPGQDPQHVLRPGMSADVTVYAR